MITKSCAVFIPRGMRHSPLAIKKVSTPIILVTTGNYPGYTQIPPENWDKDIVR